MKNNDGFTLIELLACIGIIATLAIIIGVNVNKMTQNSRNKDNYELFDRIRTSAITYSNLSDYDDSNGIISLNNLINKGLLDSDFSNISNPLYNADVKFDVDDYVEVELNFGEKNLIFHTKDDRCKLNLNDLKNAEWGIC